MSGGAITRRQHCLDTAANAVRDRGAAYGAPGPFFVMVAARWSLTLGVEVTPLQAALCLADLKIQRALTSPAGSGALDDSLVDLAGYAACAFEIGLP